MLRRDPDELATLAASEIVQIDYRRNPGGRYVGSGAVMNFITVQYDYGGNVYLSANEGLARQYGNYTGMVNYKKNALTLTLTANGKWDQLSQLNRAENVFMLNDGVFEPKRCANRGEDPYKFAIRQCPSWHTPHKTTLFDISLALTRSATLKSLEGQYHLQRPI